MEAKAEIPPIIAAHAARVNEARARRNFAPLIFIGLVAIAIGGAAISSRFAHLVPQCRFLKITGEPCAFCGGTRALRSIAHLRFADAFWWNPLVTLGAIVSALTFVAWLIVPPAKFNRWVGDVNRLPLTAIIFVAVALNWAFVLYFLPR